MARLAILQETIKKLYLYSGNECAFPGCSARIINNDGDVVAQLAHIAAAEEGGPRYNRFQSDEDRRHYSNLMYLCYPHHKKTDSPAYSVEDLQSMKAQHEARFGDNAVRRMQEALQDLTQATRPVGAFTLGALAKLEDYSLEPGSPELQSTAEGLKQFAAKLAKIPLQHRSILQVIVESGFPTRDLTRNYEMQIHELEHRLGMDYTELGPRLDLLERHELVEIDAEYRNFPMVQTREQYITSREAGSRELPVETAVWEILADFCQATGTPLSAFFIDLNFAALD
ncbi:hypothetical protein [Catellatospora chokoriensis]|uniref:HNH endonuclease n=1 Tax=Catellatospora chokoriensis TaxID=310353 RepID=A0A8J3K7B0_9ACTN|nr:hypothetical protein [Catellatospora chokoriensis]GIF89799.1 hypothetical protein Cch02nite_32430 [Catellatospora chokoriensis]